MGSLNGSVEGSHEQLEHCFAIVGLFLWQTAARRIHLLLLLTSENAELVHSVGCVTLK